MSRVSHAVRSLPDFQQLFGRPPEFVASAPGRVNLMGDHTDYNGGFVLPMTIPQQTQVELARRSDNRVKVWSANVPESFALQEYELGQEMPRHQWLDYVQGVTRLMQVEGYAVQGYDLRIQSDIPLGSGLSSSAALEVALLRALRTAGNFALDDRRLAQLGQRLEHEFVGVPVGIMDQMAASLGHPATALFLDTRTLVYERVVLPADSGLVVIHSGVSHQHAAGQYSERRRECERAAQLLGVRQLRDLHPLGERPSETVASGIETLPQPLQRRVRHVVTENLRVLQTVTAMRAGDAKTVGRLFYDSHRSLRDNYECSVPETDLLVQLAQDEAGVHGARLTGGGFGGSVVFITDLDAARSVARRLLKRYAHMSGREGIILMPAMTYETARVGES